MLVALVSVFSISHHPDMHQWAGKENASVYQCAKRNVEQCYCTYCQRNESQTNSKCFYWDGRTIVSFL